MNLRDIFEYGGLAIFNPVFISTSTTDLGLSISSTMAYPSEALSTYSGVCVSLTLLDLFNGSNDSNNINDTCMVIESMSLEELNELKSKIDEREKKLKL